MIENFPFVDVARHYGFSEQNITRVILGGNSTVLQIDTNRSTPLALKIYGGTEDRRLRSLKHELAAHHLLQNNRIIHLPKLRDSSKEFPSILYEWIDGNTPRINHNSKRTIVNCIVELRNLHKQAICNLKAVDAISSWSDLLFQIKVRHEQLLSIESFPDNLLKTMEETFQTLLVVRDEIPIDIDTLTFSDFGVHNLLLSQSNRYFFLDFEFFGQDSSVKLISDLISHPRGIFSSKEIEDIAHLLEVNFDFSQNSFLKLIALKWAYIAARRTIDIATLKYTGLTETSENPLDYIRYVEYLGQTSANTRFHTFVEFKSVR